jgi:predicted MFS family arabinose efflux permease
VTAAASPAATEPAKLPGFTTYQKQVVAILAFLQFTVILDFMILSPLSAILMPTLNITPQQFGFVVSAYAFSAGISGFLAAGFADSFDRKKLLMFFYCGFIVGTLLCALAPTYQVLLMARVVTGCFAGVVGSAVFAIITDLFAMQQRGRVMGVVQTAFAASQIMGIPAGLFLSNHWGWHMPFFAIVGVGALAGVFISVILKPVDGHLVSGAARSPREIFKHLLATVSNPVYLQAFAVTALLATGGFMLMPFGAAFSVRNLMLGLDDLPLVYFLTGLCTIVTGPLIGRLADRIGKLATFIGGSALSAVMVLYYTRLGATPLLMVVAIFAIMFVGIQSRMISSQALLSGIPAPAMRGSFMSVSSCVQQLSGGIASAIAGAIVVAPDTGPLQRFEVLGYVVVGAVIITVLMMIQVSRLVPDPAAAK